MNKIFSFFLLFLFTFSLSAQEQRRSISFYGTVRSDFYYNSRQNEQAIAGLFNMLPRPIILDENGRDRYAIPEAEMLAVFSRFGVNIRGDELFGAQVSANLEADFAGAGNTYFLVRIRHAFTRFEWENSSLLVGQTWHPLFGSVSPTMVSINTGSPFQPFNRSPQVNYVHRFGRGFSVSATALYQMQQTSLGPIGASPIYHKQAVLPELFLKLENRSNHWLSGIGFGTKTIRPNIEATLTSFSATAFAQYVRPRFQVRARALWGQNMSDVLMPNGYGVSRFDPVSGAAVEFTNFSVFSSWINIVYGSRWQIGAFAGYLQNLGPERWLAENAQGQFQVFSRGFYQNEQIIADQVYRLSAFAKHNLPNFTFGLEYNFTSTLFGGIGSHGLATYNAHSANNHRVSASISYRF